MKKNFAIVRGLRALIAICDDYKMHDLAEFRIPRIMMVGGYVREIKTVLFFPRKIKAVLSRSLKRIF